MPSNNSLMPSSGDTQRTLSGSERRRRRQVLPSAMVTSKAQATTLAAENTKFAELDQTFADTYSKLSRGQSPATGISSFDSVHEITSTENDTGLTVSEILVYSYS
jgi:hypothetical protein